MFEYSFEIKGLPVLPNGMLRQHFWKVTKEKRKWHAAVLHAVMKNIPPDPLKKAQIIYTRYSTRRPDKDGLIPSFKFVQDALIVCGVIVDDNDDVIVTEHHWEYARPKFGRIRVSIKELPMGSVE